MSYTSLSRQGEAPVQEEMSLTDLALQEEQRASEASMVKPLEVDDGYDVHDDSITTTPDRSLCRFVVKLGVGLLSILLLLLLAITVSRSSSKPSPSPSFSSNAEPSKPSQSEDQNSNDDWTTNIYTPPTQTSGTSKAPLRPPTLLLLQHEDLELNLQLSMLLPDCRKQLGNYFVAEACIQALTYRDRNTGHAVSLTWMGSGFNFSRWYEIETLTMHEPANLSIALGNVTVDASVFFYNSDDDDTLDAVLDAYFPDDDDDDDTFVSTDILFADLHETNTAWKLSCPYENVSYCVPVGQSIHVVNEATYDATVGKPPN